MGIELERFCLNVDDDFICPICKNVLENPVRLSGCEHMFCRMCIDWWMTRSATCPVDRSLITARSLIAPNRTAVSFLNRLQIKCQFESQGCQHVTSLESINNHSKGCDFNPNTKRPCGAGCGHLMNRAEAVKHRCVKMLETEVANLRNEVGNQKALAQECEATKRELTEKNSELFKLISGYVDTIQQLVEKKADLERKNSYQEKTIESLKVEFEEQKSKVKEIKLDVEQMYQKNAFLEIKNKMLEKTIINMREGKLDDEWCIDIPKIRLNIV